MTKAIDCAFEEAIAKGVFPSADLLVARGEEILFESRYGDAREDTCFDISSLTKPVSSATLAMFMIAEGLLKYEDTVYQWLAGARQSAHKSMTIRHLLNHTSGIPDWQPYFRELPISLVGTEAGKRFILENCYNEPLLAEPGEKTIYSDIGYIILGEILEQAGSAELDALFAQYIARPLGIENTFFVRTLGAPLQTSSKRTDTTAKQHTHVSGYTPKKEGSASDKKHRRFAPTEDCPWRERVIHGEVHDQNAYALGGVAGHAGLFSTARDLNTFSLELTRCYFGKSDWIPQNVTKEFIQEGKTKPVGNEFVLGWNRPSKKNSASGHHFSPNTIGHLGYTGCSIWIDLNEDFRIILLTNRIHPSSTNQKISLFRPRIHDLIYVELIKK